MNGIGRDTYNVVSGNILADDELDKAYSGKKYDVVEANIVADVIIALTEKIPQYIKDGGIFVSSGIIVERLDDVLEALKSRGFALIEVVKDKGWAAVASKYEG